LSAKVSISTNDLAYHPGHQEITAENTEFAGKFMNVFSAFSAISAVILFAYWHDHFLL